MKLRKFWSVVGAPSLDLPLRLVLPPLPGSANINKTHRFTPKSVRTYSHQAKARKIKEQATNIQGKFSRSLGVNGP